MLEKLAQILNAKWLVTGDTLLNYLPIFVHFINGGKLSEAEFHPTGNTLSYVNTTSGALVLADNLMNPSIPKDSVAVIPIEGVITAWQSQEIEQSLLTAYANDNIMSILLLMNTPGGMVYYTDILASTIKNSPKPILSFVRNITASAGMWLASASSRILVSSPIDQLGSIGVQCTIMDINNMLQEKFNINIFNLTATKSVNKNIELRSLLVDKNPELIVANLDYVNEIFHTAIEANLGIPRSSEIYAGGIYYAQQAIELGLAHEITSLSEAIDQTVKAGFASSIRNLLI